MAGATTTLSLSTLSISPSNSFTHNKLISTTHRHRTNHFSPPNFTTLRPKTTPITTQIRASIKSTNSTSEQKWTHEGVITESLPNGMFMVKLENEEEVLGYISGRIRRSSIRILPGDRVKIEVSRYDSNRGRIVYRLRGKDLNENPTTTTL